MVKLNIRDFSKEEIPVAIADWLDDKVKFENNYYAKNLINILSKMIRKNYWLVDLEDKINETK